MREDAVVDIQNVAYVDGYVLRLFFSDGAEQIIDFGPFLSKSQNPLIRRYLDLALFKDFTLEHGDLFWHDYDLCFSIADLYEARI